MFVDNDNKWIVNIGHDCWIGEHVFMVGGVTVNNGAVVLAHAVVTKDVPPYAIVGGIPAKVIGYRYDEETIAFLLKKCCQVTSSFVFSAKSINRIKST